MIKKVKKVFINLGFTSSIRNINGKASIIRSNARLNMVNLCVSVGNFVKKIKFRYFLPSFMAIFILIPVAILSYYYVLPMYYGMLKEQHEVSILKNRIRVDYEKDQIFKIIASFHSGLPTYEESKISDLILHIGGKYMINPALILAVIRVESSFNNFSHSNMGAVGLMQIRPATGLYLIKKYNIKSKKFHYNTKYIEYLPVSYLYNPSLNIRIGARYLLSLLYEFKNLKLALFAYNAGPTVVFKAINLSRVKNGLNVASLKDKRDILSRSRNSNRLFSDFYYGYYKRVEKYFKIYNKDIFRNDGNFELSWGRKNNINTAYSNDKVQSSLINGNGGYLGSLNGSHATFINYR